MLDGEQWCFEIKNINKNTLNDMIRRSQYHRDIFLSLVITKPQLNAYEWYTEVPASYIDQIMERIIKYVEE